ncbi:hypothetical protein LEAN103870_14150 [Legionella anisa]|uniref:Uncharacterized protein n=1 Tax=Legionella anisa TaxID=28082 RepID=A0AAX0WT10_9GAMM|nr:hypothetical protein [Legionella anisa]AWN74606.1 hypothetical protein DLD14_12575 [Legionella anisa]KTC76213.1 hypothetical protein Lani_0502 [Legionella anisa]MBN5937236.1 hypothetical protein [Legionella anisa]MCW8425278.1 hypothetical protein [Legionella anisa]MCW8449293.1 hypothetical protein [Legionella anisa]
MLYLIGEEEVNYIFGGRTFNEITHRAIKTYKKRPGFFTPYKNGYEFVGELIAPGVYPLAGIVTAGFSAFASIVSAVVCIGALLVAAGSALFSASELRDDALYFAGSALYFSGIALLTAAMSALLGIISFPHSVLSVVTRSVATVIDAGTVSDAETLHNEAVVDMDEDEYAFRCI